MTIHSDIAIVGAGPGGYVAALRAAQLGARVVLLEKDRVGGVCLNQGCIPTKTLLRSAEVLKLAQAASGYGVTVGEVTLDWQAAQKRKDRLVRRVTGGVKLLLEKAGVHLLSGTARFVSPSALELAGQDGTERIEASNFVVAAGARAASLPIPGLEGPGLLTSDEAVTLESLPRNMLRVLPGLDADLSSEIERALKKLKVKVYTSGKVTHVEPRDGLYEVIIAGDSQEMTLKVEKVLLAVGRRPNVEELGLTSARVQFDKTGIKVNDRLQTNVPHVYAVGDVTGGILLAHVAMHEGVVAVENALGHARRMNYAAVPSCVFSWPEVATVGLSEEEAREQGYKVQVGKFPFRANGKALALGERSGWVKVVADSEYGQILGVHIVGPHASDLILEGTMALTLEATLDEFEAIIHPHPTLSEVVAEAALAAKGRALHMKG